MKLTLAQKLEKRKAKSPPIIIYPILKAVVLETLAKKWNTEFEFKVDTKKIKGPFVAVFNHASRNDYVFTALAFPKHRLNFIAGYNEFFRSHLQFIFSLANVIPKRNFVPDLHTIMEATRVIRKGGVICFSPEGMNSISGANQPVALGTGKFLKHLKVPVYFVKIQGGYLMGPKYCLDDRIGKVKVTTDALFSVEQLNEMSPDQIEEKLNEVFTHDDYEYNLKEQIEYKCDEMAKNMHTYLYRCPKCGKEFTMRSKGNDLYCEECGNGVTLDQKYNLHPLTPDSVFPTTPKRWYDWQRQMIYREIKNNPDFCLTEKVKLGCLPDYEYLTDYKTSEIVGEGTITISRKGFDYVGTKKGEPFTFHLTTDELPTYGMCTDMTRFYTFYNKEFCEFYPERESVAKWFLVTEELHRIKGGKWKNLPSANDIYGDDLIFEP